MATAIRTIPTLYVETAKSFESEAARTEQNLSTQDYRNEYISLTYITAPTTPASVRMRLAGKRE